jgi:hypothetical protein
MTQQRRPIFREHALQQYIQRQENDVLPQIVSPPVFLFFWLLVVLVIVAGVLAWMERVPTYVSGTGVAVSGDYRVNAQQNAFEALIFVPASERQQIRSGLTSLVRINASGETINTSVASLDTHIYSPDAAQRRYALSCNVAQNLTEPTLAVRMHVLIPAQVHIQNGTSVHAQVQVGMQRVLSLFPVFDGFMGGS